MRLANCRLFALPLALVSLTPPSAYAGLQEGLIALKAKDYVSGLKEIRPLAEEGNAIAQYNLAIAYERGLGGLQRDVKEAMGWAEKSSAQGYSRASVYLGAKYRDGKDVSKDYKRALELFINAADKEDDAAFYDLSEMYRLGEGTERNLQKAFATMKRLADAQHPVGEYRVGLAYHLGEGVKNDNAEGLRWIERAADQGYGPAMATLGSMYGEGDGVKRDSRSACFWAKGALTKELAATDVAGSQSRAAQYCSALDETDRSKIDTRLANWRPDERWRRQQEKAYEALLAEAMRQDRARRPAAELVRPKE
jgi:TPR repeat protein